MDNELISVIVPVYNVEKYLKRCIDSIINQTYSNLEIILVDDGSTDSSGELCNEYLEKDSRIKVFHKKNGGLSSARNYGIDRATGLYISFVDSDDWIHKEMLEVLIQSIKKYNVSISMCNFVRTDKFIPDKNGIKAQSELVETEKIYINENLMSTIACAKLYASNCFESIRYPIGKIHEDEYTTYKILFLFPQIAVVNEAYYYYYCNRNGITQSLWNRKRCLDAFCAYDEQLKYFKSRGLLEVYRKQIMSYMIDICVHIDKSKKSKLLNDKICFSIFLRNKLKKMIFLYGSNIKIDGLDDYWIYESAYPILVKIYSFMKIIQRKIER